MKRIILKMGVLGVFCLVAGCSDDGSTSPLQPVADNETESSSDKAVDNSSSGTAPSSASSTNSSASKEGDSQDTSVVHQQVVITDSGTVEGSTYISSGVFCWTEGCEAKYASSSSAAPQSSEGKIVITESSSSAAPPPVVEGNTLKDNRNGKSYKLQNVAGKMWMAQDLNYERSGSMCFNNEDANCTKYGRLYTFSSAQEACPAGWRLPNRNEAQAVINDESFPWSYSGRCKTGECDFTEKMGFHWTSATPQDGDKNYGEKTGEIAVIIVEKNPDSDYAAEPANFFQVDCQAKLFSVRCVEGE
jgi:uncharacterized protein (TIGR02145 family)